jgi:predicted transcriptional regulator
VSDLERFHDLMFEVSNEDRVSILRELRKERSTYSDLSRKLDITTQEVSRHLSRLTENGLTTRRTDGLLELTSYGELVLRQLNAVEFTSKHREYFVSHVLNGLPDKFVSRMGELRECTLNLDVMVSIHRVQKILQETEEYVWNLNLPYIASAFPYVKNIFERGIEGRFLHGEELQLPDEMRGERERVFSDDEVRSLKAAGLYKERRVEAGLIIYMSEKELALLCFPEVDGRFDYMGFTTTDLDALEWCGDVFLHYWEQGTEVK